MLFFLIGIAILILGYYIYGRFVEQIVSPDNRETPAVKNADGVDYVVLPHWKNMLIQLLNIAGVGPVIGVILGIKFGDIVFFIIPLGNIIGGAVHDYMAGMMSLRNNGANLPWLIRKTMGTGYSRFFSVFMSILLLLVVAVFINIPAGLIDKLFPSYSIFWLVVGLIFLYYILATLFPVDKIIGKIYPFFGLMLLFGTFMIFLSLAWNTLFDMGFLASMAKLNDFIAGIRPAQNTWAYLWDGFSSMCGTVFSGLMGTHDELLCENAQFTAFAAGFREKNPVIPVLFVTIACGILSGFHATQSPIIARTMFKEKNGRSAFYGMMIVEGIIGMIWAAGGLAIYNMDIAQTALSADTVLVNITTRFLGPGLGLVTVLAVVILAITSGDTAMRSLRLSLAEMFHLDQRPFSKRIFICIPLILIVSGLLWWSNISAKTFGQLWNYFAWGNQVLAASTLMAVSVWLMMQKKQWIVTMVPGLFMTFIVLTYILWISPAHGGPVGFGMPLYQAYGVAVTLTLLLGVWVYQKGKQLQAPPLPDLK